MAQTVLTPQGYALLALCAQPYAHDRLSHALQTAVSGFHDWEALCAQAELLGVAPLFWHHLRSTGISLPHKIQQILQGLTARHAILHRVHKAVLFETLDTLHRKRLQPLLLKGLALAWQAYPTPQLRPLGDIDLLLQEEQVQPALAVLCEKGYQILSQNFSIFAKEIVLLAPPQFGLTVRIELHQYHPSQRLVHQNTLDNEFRDMLEAPQRLILPEREIWTTSPIDSLLYLMRHLRKHLFDARPDRPLSLKWVSDILGLAQNYATQINWTVLKQRDSRFLNRLAILYALTPVPREHEAHLPLQSIPTLTDFGQYPAGWPRWPVAGVTRENWLKYIWNTLSPPPTWWIRLYEGVTGNIVWHRHILYRLRLLGWAYNALWARFKRNL